MDNKFKVGDYFIVGHNPGFIGQVLEVPKNNRIFEYPYEIYAIIIVSLDRIYGEGNMVWVANIACTKIKKEEIGWYILTNENKY